MQRQKRQTTTSRLNGKVKLEEIQAIWQIYQAIEKRKTNAPPIAEDSPEVPELEVLLDGLCGTDNLVTHASGAALVNLVKTGILHHGRAIDMLLAAAPSVTSAQATIRALHRLLTTEALATLASEGFYRCPYGLRFEEKLLHDKSTVMVMKKKAKNKNNNNNSSTNTHDITTTCTTVADPAPAATTVDATAITTEQLKLSW
ncbi:hypothetical protein PoB_006077800 [Plakobranchus ocellatus]|uniref:Uncharacterized protein n=1 Tax=Plakobranchus ocellatus TaxID=259542 RepID=A0AAV4CQV1_9GAST|nr:hypothetical protein PoB_006077800 [Plakobranchus ocellatus]